MEQLIKEIKDSSIYTHNKKGGRYKILNQNAQGKNNGVWSLTVIYESLNTNDLGQQYTRRYVDFLCSFTETE